MRWCSHMFSIAKLAPSLFSDSIVDDVRVMDLRANKCSANEHKNNWSPLELEYSF